METKARVGHRIIIAFLCGYIAVLVGLSIAYDHQWFEKCVGALWIGLFGLILAAVAWHRIDQLKKDRDRVADEKHSRQVRNYLARLVEFVETADEFGIDLGEGGTRMAATRYKFRIWESQADKQWRWSLDAPNGESVASGGEGFVSEASCRRSIDLVRKNAGAAPIEVIDDPNAK